MGERGGDRTQQRIDAQAEALREAGASPHAIAQFRARRERNNGNAMNVIVVEPENVAALRVFRQMQSQWHVTPVCNGRRTVLMRTGIDYGALAPIAAALRIDLDETTMDGIRLLEAETLAIHTRRQQQLLMQR